MTGFLIKRENVDTDRHAQREEDVKTQGADSMGLE